MAQQNPWKKQLQANKQNFNQPANNNTNSPINQWKQNQTTNNSSPSWMKKKQENQNNTSGNNQPAWMKKKQQQSTNNSNNQPAWMKKKQEQNTNNSNNQPAWMKKKQQPPSTTTSGPAWMKKPGQQSTNSNINQSTTNSPWKANKFQSPQQKLQRQKKQKEEQQKRQKQLEQKKLAQQKERKEKQQENQKRQTLKMEKEDSLSKQYQILVKQEIINKKQQKIREQAQELQKQKKSKKSSKKHTKSNKQREQCESQTIFHKYLHYFDRSVSKIDQYRAKLQSQKDLIELVNKFVQTSAEVIKTLIKQRKIYEKKRKIINFPDIQIMYGFCQGKKQKQTIIFDFTQTIKFQKCFQFYSDLQDIITSLCKKMGNFKIRAPLVVLIKYKGISFFCQAVSQQLNELMFSQAKDFKELSNQLILLQKQLQEYGYSLTKQDLQIKKINFNDSEHYILYIKQSQIQKLTNIKSQIVKLTDHYSLTQRNLKYFLNQNSLQHCRKMQTLFFNHYTQIAYLAQCINIVYESCQGQVQQMSFWKLVLQKNQQIWSLIRCAGYKGQMIKQNILFVYFECLSGFQFQYRKNMFQKAKINVKYIKCMISHYQFNKFELNEIKNNFQKYLKESKTQLVQESLKISQQLYKSGEINNTDNLISLIKKKGKYLLYQKKYRQVVQFYKNQIKKLKKYDFIQIQLKIQLIAILIEKDKEEEVLKTLTSLLELLQYYYFQQTLLHSSLYQMMGTYYSRKKERAAEVIKFFQHALGIVIKIYGDQKYQVGQIYLSRSAAFINLKRFDLFQKDIQNALKIFKSSSKYSGKIAQCYFYMGKVKILQNNMKQAIEFIQSAANIYMKIENYVQAVNVLLMTLDFLTQDKKYQQIAQKVINTCLNYKNQFYLTKIITKILLKTTKQYSSQTILQQILKEKQPPQEELDSSNILLSLNQIQTILKTFSNFFQMLKWSFTILNSRKLQTSQYQKARNIIELLSQFYKLENRGEDQEQNIEDIDNDSQSIYKNSDSQSPNKERSQKNQIDEKAKDNEIQQSERNYNQLQKNY